MSYSVHVFPRALEKKFKAAMDPAAFFEKTANLLPLGTKLTKQLVEALTLRGFVEGKKTKNGRAFHCEAWAAEALLTESGLYLSAGGDGTFEILMFGDEVADKQLAKFDPQEGTWA